MSVRFRRSGNGVISDHMELINRGVRTHEEIDSYLDELDSARGLHPSIDTRLQLIEDGTDSHGEAIAELELKVADLEDDLGDVITSLSGLSTTVGGHTTKISSLETSVSGLSTTVGEQGTTLSNLKTEVETARGGEQNLNARLVKLESKSIDDLRLLSGVYEGATNSVVVTVAKGTASLNGKVLRLAQQTFAITSPNSFTTYYVFLKEDGTLTRRVSIEETKSDMLLGSVTVGATLSVITITDLRYFVTKGGNTETADEVVEARVGMDGTIHPKLKDRLDSLETKIKEFEPGTLSEVVTVDTEGDLPDVGESGVLYVVRLDSVLNLQPTLFVYEGVGYLQLTSKPVEGGGEGTAGVVQQFSTQSTELTEDVVSFLIPVGAEEFNFLLRNGQFLVRGRDYNISGASVFFASTLRSGDVMTFITIVTATYQEEINSLDLRSTDLEGQVGELQSRVTDLESQVTDLESYITAIEGEVASMSMAPKMVKVVESHTIQAEGTKFILVDVGLNKCRLENLYAKSVNGDDLELGIYDDLSKSFRVYKALTASEIYDILSLPYQDEEGSTFVYLEVKNLSLYSNTVDIRLVVTELA